MEHPYWHKQAAQPLFPELEWSRPENKQQAGKLLIIGGNEFGFVAPADAYSAAEQAGIGAARMVLPDSLSRYIGKTFTAGTLAPSTPSGSFGQAAYATFTDEAAWADGVLIAGDVGRNSETTMVLEHFFETYEGRVTITKDAADLFCVQPSSILQRSTTLLVISLGQLQKLGVGAKFSRAFTSSMGLVQLVESLHEFTKRYAPHIVVKHHDQLVVAVSGEVSTTKLVSELPVWRLKTAATASVWWLQNPSKPFEALTSAVQTHQTSK